MRFGRTGSRLLAVCLLLLAFILAFSGCTVFAVRPAVSGETTGAETTGTTEPAEGSLVALLLENEEIPAFNQAVAFCIRNGFAEKDSDQFHAKLLGQFDAACQ